MKKWNLLGKFSLQYCDLPTQLTNVAALFRLLSVNIDARHSNRIPIHCVILTAMGTSTFLYVYLFSALWYTFWGSKAYGDLSAIYVEFSLFATSSIPVIKLAYMKLYQERIQQLTSRYLDSDAREVEGSRFSINILKILKHVKRRGFIYWWILILDGLCYFLLPLMRPGRHLSADVFVVYGLEPMMESPNWEIATVVMGINIIFVCYAVGVIACLLIFLIGFIEAQMIALSYEMTSIRDDALQHYKETAVDIDDSDNAETEAVDEYIRIHLVDLARRHAMNISSLLEIEDVMRGPNAVGFLFLIAGLTAELLGGLERTFLQLPFTMLQLSVDCYLGQKVNDANMMFENAVYDCQWESFNQKNKKLVLVILQNAQKTMTMTAGGMAMLNFRTLMAIIKTTYSAYTTLRHSA